MPLIATCDQHMLTRPCPCSCCLAKESGSWVLAFVVELSRYPHPSSVTGYSKTNVKSGHISNSPIPSWCYSCNYTGYSHASFRMRYNLLLLLLNQSTSKRASYAKRKGNLSICPVVRLARVIVVLAKQSGSIDSVSYTHLTLPTKRIV